MLKNSSVLVLLISIANLSFASNNGLSSAKSLEALFKNKNNQRVVNCIRSASIKSNIPEYLLFAIADHESGLNPHVVNKNKNGTLDIGLMQINTVHLPFFIKVGGKIEQLLDPCINALMGAYLLKKEIDTYGMNAYAIGRYHSATPVYRERYSAAICNRLRGMQIC